MGTHVSQSSRPDPDLDLKLGDTPRKRAMYPKTIGPVFMKKIEPTHFSIALICSTPLVLVSRSNLHQDFTSTFENYLCDPVNPEELLGNIYSQATGYVRVHISDGTLCLGHVRQVQALARSGDTWFLRLCEGK